MDLGLFTIPQSLAVAIVVIVAVVAGLGVLGAAIYGVCKKFSRMGWLAWQILLSVLVLLTVNWIPETLPKASRFWLGAVVLLLGLGLVFGGGLAARYFMLKRYRKAPTALNVLDRIFGGITAVLDVVMVLAIPAAFALCIMYFAFPAPLQFMEGFYALPVWDFFAPFLFDVFVIAMFALLLRTGFRVGFGRMFLILFMLALTFGAFLLSVFMTLRWGLFRGMANGIGGWFKIAGPAIRYAIGSLITIFLLFAVLFVVIGLIGWGLNKLVNYCRYNYVTGLIDGAVLAVVFFVMLLMIACGINALVAWLAGGGVSEMVDGIARSLENVLVGAMGEQAAETASGFREALSGICDAVQTVAKGIEALFRSAPLSRLLYEANPFAAVT